MRTGTVTADRRGHESEYSAIDRLQLLERQYHSALDHLEKEQHASSFGVFSDVLLPVSLLFLVVLWGCRLNAATADAADGREDRAALLVYGVGLIVVSGAACVYVAVRMTIVRPGPGRPAAEIRPLYAARRGRSRKYYYCRTVPEIHRTGRKPTPDVFVV